MKRKQLLIAILAALSILLAVLVAVLINFATSTIPPFVQHYLPFAWPLLGFVALAWMIVAIFLIRLQAVNEGTASTREGQNRQRMLAKVYAFWIKDVLEKNLHGATLITLGLQEKPEAVENLWRLVFQQLQQPAQPLPPGMTITQVYNDAGNELLILGEPGAGKTTLLLELARDLLERARLDETYPLPVVFNLSSWAKKQQPLTEWLIEELLTKYQVPQKIGRTWVESDQILALLDGLDEVAETARAACVDAINNYRKEHGLLPTVVCSRSTEYNDLMKAKHRLQLHSAVVIQPLTAQQIDDYLSSAGGQLATVRVALRKDVELQELTTTPLMLSVLTLTYQGKRVEDLLTTGSPETRQRQVFEHYVTRMLTRRRPLQPLQKEQFLAWLSYLAKQLHRQQQTVLTVEYLQPDWLPGKQRHLYRWSLGLVAVPVFGLLLGLFVGLQNWLSNGLGAGLSFGLFAGLGFEMLAELFVWQVGGLFSGQDGDRIRPAEAISWSWKGVWKTLISQLSNGLMLGLVFVLIAWLIIGLLNGLLNGVPVVIVLSALVLGLLLVLFIRVARVVKPAERAELDSAPGPWKGALDILFNLLFVSVLLGLLGLLVKLLDWQRSGLFNGLIPLLPVGLISELGVGLIVGLSVGLGVGLGSGLIKGLRNGLSMKQLTERTDFSPNEGIRLSGKNGLLVGAFVGLADGLLAWLVAGLLFGHLGFPLPVVLGLFVGLLFGVGAALFVGLLYGLNAFVQHFTLRFWLWRTNCLPWNLIAFLDEAVERLLLRKEASGSYIFRHQLLHDYFASLGEPASVDSVSPNRGHPFKRMGVVLLLVLTLIGASMHSIGDYFLSIPHLTPESTSFAALSASPITHVGSVDSNSLTVSNGMFFFSTSIGNGTGTYLHALNATSGKQKWIYHSSGNASSPRPITVVNDTVYFTTSASKTSFAYSLHALDTASGKQKWIWTSPLFVPMFTYFTVNSSIIYVITVGMSDKGHKVIGTYLYALNAASGAQKWTYHVSSYSLSSSQLFSILNLVNGILLAVDNGTVYFASFDSSGSYLHALNASTGTQKWTYHVSESLHRWWDDFVVDNGIVYFVTHNGYKSILDISSGNTYVYALDATSGTRKWTYRVSGSLEFDLVVDDGIIYLGIIDSTIKNMYFYALDAVSGMQKWTYHSPDFFYLPKVDNGIVYFGTSNNNHTYTYFHAFDVISETQKWTYYHSSGGLPLFAPSVDNGIVYFDAYDSSGTDIYALNAASGLQKWSAHVYTVAATQPTVNNGIVYFFAIGNDKNIYFYALNAASGLPLWSAHPSGFFDESFFGFNATLVLGVSLSSLFTAMETLLTIDGGIVYFAIPGNTDHTDTYLYALDATSGVQKWGYFIYP